jgi:hypothetical protein
MVKKTRDLLHLQPRRQSRKPKLRARMSDLGYLETRVSVRRKNCEPYVRRRALHRFFRRAGTS